MDSAELYSKLTTPTTKFTLRYALGTLFSPELTLGFFSNPITKTFWEVEEVSNFYFYSLWTEKGKFK